MTKLKKTLLLLAVCASMYGYGQKQPLEPALKAAIEKGMKASVRAWGFDTARQQQNSAQFSAVVIDADGYILTVAHAIKPNGTYKIRFPDGKEALAVGLGRLDLDDPPTIPDAGVMKILGDGIWPFTPMGNSALVKSGDPCFTIGYPESLDQLFPTIRFGYIKGVSAEFGFLLSSSVMEVGDSGGPLFDMKGQVIGLNSRCESSEDENLHVPVNLYRKYWTSMIKPQYYSKFPPEDGITIDISGGQPTSFAEPVLPILKNKGPVVTIESMIEGKRVQILGTAFTFNNNGSYIVSKSSCVGSEALLLTNGGSQKKLTVLNRSPKHDLVLLYSTAFVEGALKNADTSYLPSSPLPGTFVFALMPGGRKLRGIAGADAFALPAKFSSGYFGANAQWKDGAATISRFFPNSPVRAAGLIEGDKILKISGQPVNKPADYGTILMQYFPKDTITLDVMREDSLFYQPIVLAEKYERVTNHLADQFAGGKSLRRDGFPSVWPCDARLMASQCGSALLDAQGKFCGIAISRFSRTVVLVIPPREVNNWLKYVFEIGSE